MPAIARLMKRLGYAKLSNYGLVLTPEGRVLSMRPAVLDDGLGGRIVGWEDGDLAAMELEKWQGPPAPKAAVATRVAAPPKRPPVPTRPVPVVTHPTPVPGMVVRETSLPITVAPVPTIKQTVYATPQAAPVAPRKVAPEPVVEEDDWEWTIAIARARAAAEESEVAASQPPPAPPKFVKAKTLPIAKVADTKPDPMSTDAWPKTEPLGDFDYTDQTAPIHDVVKVARMAHTPRVVLPAKATPPKAMPVVVPVVAAPVPAQARDYPRAKSPATVIPVPKLPSIANPRPAQVAPAMRAPTEQPRRFAKGTGPYLPKTAPMTIVPEPRNDDDTVPGMVLPTVAQPSLKRVSRG